MQKTEILQLNIIEGTDVPSHAVFNENFNKLDDFASETNNKVSEMNNRVETVEENVDTKISEMETKVDKQIEDLNTKFDKTVVVLEEKISKVEIEVDGEMKKGTLKKLVVKTQPNYSSFYQPLPIINTNDNTLYDLNEKRVLVTSYSGYGSINLTGLIGLADVNDILVLSSQIYSDEYVAVTSGQTNTVPMDCFSVQKLTYPGAPNDIYLTYKGSNTSFNIQDFKGATSGGWQPSITPSTPISEVYIVLNYVIFDK